MKKLLILASLFFVSSVARATMAIPPALEGVREPVLVASTQGVETPKDSVGVGIMQIPPVAPRTEAAHAPRVAVKKQEGFSINALLEKFKKMLEKSFPVQTPPSAPDPAKEKLEQKEFAETVAGKVGEEFNRKDGIGDNLAEKTAKETSAAVIKSLSLPFWSLIVLIIVGFIANTLYGKRNSDRVEGKVDAVPLKTTEEILTHNVVGNVASIRIGCWLIEYRPEFVGLKVKSLYVPKTYMTKPSQDSADIPTATFDTIAQVATSMKSIIKIDADGKFIFSSMSAAQWEVIKRESDAFRLTTSRVN